MELNKKSKKTDAIVNLYRAAFYLASGSNEIGINLLKKAKREIGESLNNKLSIFLKNPQKALKTHQQQLYWAEKVLDEYKRQLFW